MAVTRSEQLGTTHPRRWEHLSIPPLTRQLGLIVAAFLAYMGVRALANGAESRAVEHARHLLDFESAIGLDWEHRIQGFVLGRPDWMSFFNLIYAWTYWPMIIGAFSYTWFRNRPYFFVFRDAMFLSGAVGLVVFALFPVAPPRFIEGFVDTVDATDRSHFIAHPSFLINKFAALPSFHVGWVALASVVLALATPKRWLKVVLAIPPMLMSVAVVTTGNHYLVDVAAGLALSLGGLAAVLRRRRRKGSLAARATPRGIDDGIRIGDEHLEERDSRRELIHAGERRTPSSCS